MSSNFVNSLRTGSTIRAGTGSGESIVIRAQLLDAWDAVRIETTSDSTVREAKDAAVHALDPTSSPDDDYVVKVGGFEVLDESATLEDIGATTGTILAIGHRFRRPVR
jgi:hypothetical protein